MKNSIVFTIVATIALTVTASAQAQIIRGVPMQRAYQQQGVPYYQQGTPVMQNQGRMTNTVSGEIELPPMSEADLAKSDIGATFLDAGSSGLRVGSVFAKSPAKSAGFRTGDFVTKVDGKAVPNAAAFKTMIAEMDPGSKVKLTHKRGTEERDVDVAVMQMKEIVNASIVAEPGTFDRAIAQTNQQILGLKQKVMNAEQDLKDAQQMLAGQEKRLAELKVKAAADLKKMEADKAAEKQ
ncbi:PDZ domain-containing protein [Mariniblastus sp.]|nr:PDZ domain-containing protein [Mariniblastus sp.]